MADDKTMEELLAGAPELAPIVAWHEVTLEAIKHLAELAAMLAASPKGMSDEVELQRELQAAIRAMPNQLAQGPKLAFEAARSRRAHMRMN